MPRASLSVALFKKEKRDFFLKTHASGLRLQCLNLTGVHPKIFLNCFIKFEMSLKPQRETTSSSESFKSDLRSIAASYNLFKIKNFLIETPTSSLNILSA